MRDIVPHESTQTRHHDRRGDNNNPGEMPVGMAKSSMSRYMKNKLSKSHMQIIENHSNDYNAAIPVSTTPTRTRNRSLLDDETQSSASGFRSSIGSTSRRYQQEGGKRQQGHVDDHVDSNEEFNSIMDGHCSQDHKSLAYSSISSTQHQQSAATGATSATSNLELPLPQSKVPFVKALYGREQEMLLLEQRLTEGAGLTCISGTGGVGKSYLIAHACNNWLAKEPFGRFVIWINAASEWTLRISYLEALQQVLMGNMKHSITASGTEEDDERGEIIIVADLLHRQLNRQRRKEEAKEAMRERRRRHRELQNNGQANDERRDDQEGAAVFSEDSEDWADDDDVSVQTPEDNEEETLDTKTLANLLWDALLQGVSQDFEWIIVVQNLPGGMAGVQGPDGIKPVFFPTAETPEEDWSQGRIVFTTRHPNFGGRTCLGPIYSLRLERLDEAAAIKMIVTPTVFDGTTQQGRENLDSHNRKAIQKDAERVAGKLIGPHYLDCSPLMIATAVGQIMSSGWSLRRYYAELKHQVAEALAASGCENGKVQSSVKRECAMSVCLEQAMDNAHARGLADILSAAAFVSGDSIPLKLLGGDTERVEQLCDMHLLSHVGKDTYSMHRVHQRTAVDAIVANVSKSGEQSFEENEEFLCTPDHAVLALRSVMSGFAPDRAATWRLVRSCIPHVEAIRIHHDLLARKDQLPSNFNHAFYAEIIHSNATALQWAMKDRAAAFKGFNEALRLQRRLFRYVPSSDLFSTSSSSNVKADLAAGIAKTLASLGGLAEKPEVAQTFYKEALTIYCQTFGEDSKSIELMTLNVALADTEVMLQHGGVAYDLYKKGLELYFTIFGHNQNVYADDQKQFLAGVLQKLGSLAHHQLKKHAEAELYLDGSVSLLHNQFDAETDAKRDELANVLETLGSACHAQGRVKDARQHYKNALKIKDKVHGDKKWTKISNKYGTLSTQEGERSASSGYNGSIMSCSGSAESDDVEDVKMHSASVDDFGNYALEIVPVDSETRNRASASRDIKLAKTLHRLGVMAWNLGSLKQAEEYFEKALSMQYNGYGDDAKNEDIAITLFSLGGLCNDLHNNQERACCYYKKALECYHQTHGKDAQTESIAQLLHACGQSLQVLKRPQEAKWHLKQALEMKFALYGDKDANPDLVATQLDLGKVSRDLEANEDARHYFKAALKGLYAIHGRDAKNVQLASCLTQLGGLSYNSGILGDAKKYFEKCLEMKLYMYGHDEFNDDIASTLNNLGSLNARMHKPEEAFRYYKQALEQYTKMDEQGGDDVVEENEDIKTHRARTLHNLGLLSANMRRFADAKKYYTESLKIKSEVFKDVEDSPDLALTLTKLSYIEERQGKHEAAKYYQNQAIKRSPTFLETHKSLINKELLPATAEEAAALIVADPSKDDGAAQEMLQAMEFWQGHLEKGESTKSCWFPFKNRSKDKKQKNKAEKTDKKPENNPEQTNNKKSKRKLRFNLPG